MSIPVLAVMMEMANLALVLVMKTAIAPITPSALVVMMEAALQEMMGTLAQLIMMVTMLHI